MIRVLAVWLLQQIRTALRRLFRRPPPRSIDPVFVAAEVGAILTQLALSNIGKPRLTIEDCLAAVTADKRQCDEDFVRAHLRAAARSCKPLRSVVPLEALEGIEAGGDPDQRWNVTRTA